MARDEAKPMTITDAFAELRRAVRYTLASSPDHEKALRDPINLCMGRVLDWATSNMDLVQHGDPEGAHRVGSLVGRFTDPRIVVDDDGSNVPMNGGTLLRDRYPRLAEVLRDAYSRGDEAPGEFRLPDYRGTFPS